MIIVLSPMPLGGARNERRRRCRSSIVIRGDRVVSFKPSVQAFIMHIAEIRVCSRRRTGACRYSAFIGDLTQCLGRVYHTGQLCCESLMSILLQKQRKARWHRAGSAINGHPGLLREGKPVQEDPSPWGRTLWRQLIRYTSPLFQVGSLSLSA